MSLESLLILIVQKFNQLFRDIVVSKSNNIAYLTARQIILDLPVINIHVYTYAEARILSRNIAELDLSVRANNCLESAKIGTVGELVSYAESDLLKVRSFGKTSLMEVKRKLSDLGLSLGMDLSQRSTAPEEPDEPMPENPQMAEEPAGMNN